MENDGKETRRLKKPAAIIIMTPTRPPKAVMASTKTVTRKGKRRIFFTIASMKRDVFFIAGAFCIRR
jgi:hypothetical protein